MKRFLPDRLLLATFCVLLSACGPRDPAAGKDRAASLAGRIDADFRAVRLQVERLAADIAALYPRRAELAAKADVSLYAFSPDGAFYKTRDDGRCALWVSAAVPVTPGVREIAYFTEAIDPELMRICREQPAVCQAYYNDRHSLNRIYPWFDVLAQYPPRMNIPDFNFYYLADASHNPARKGVWVDEPYVDPAGQGWMVSAIAPVYVDGVLEGVPGLDISIARLISRYFGDTSGSVLVVSRSGVIVAASERAIQTLEMPPLRNHKYLETVKLDTFKPDEYNLRKSTLRPVRELAAKLLDTGAASAPCELDGRPLLAVRADIPELGWHVIEFIPR